MFGFRKVTTIASALALAISGNAATAQKLSPDLQALDEQLPGTLINDPSVIDWTVYGNAVSSEPVVDKQIPGGGAALKITIKSANEFVYAAGLNIPLIRPVDSGDQITIGFYARAVSARTSDGKGALRVRFQQDAPPYPGFGETSLSIGPEWQWYEVTAKAEIGLRQKDGIVSVQFGTAEQVLEIGQTIVVKGASAIASAAAAANPQAPAPTSTKAEASLPDSLKGIGTLLNNPSKSDWYFGAEKGEFEQLQDLAVFGVGVTRFSVTKPDTKPHELFTSVPLTSAIAAGDNLVIAIAARTASAGGGTVPTQIGVRIEEAKPPYNGFSDNRIALGENWRLIRVNTKAAMDLAAGEGQLAIHLGGAQTAVDIGPVYIFRTNAPDPQ